MKENMTHEQHLALIAHRSSLRTTEAGVRLMTPTELADTPVFQGEAWPTAVDHGTVELLVEHEKPRMIVPQGLEFNEYVRGLGKAAHELYGLNVLLVDAGVATESAHKLSAAKHQTERLDDLNGPLFALVERRVFNPGEVSQTRFNQLLATISHVAVHTITVSSPEAQIMERQSVLSVTPGMFFAAGATQSVA